MNTDQTTNPTTRRFVRTARTVLTALAISATATAVGVGPASAATAPAPNVKTCFYYADTGGAMSNAPVKLYEAAPTAKSWTAVRSGTTNSAGCVTFVGVHRGYRYHGMLHKVIGDSNTGMAVFDGTTNVATTGSTGTLGLTGWIYQRCIAGLYGSIC